MKTCHACGAIWEEKHEPGRGETCMQCGADMHCCMNCRMYDPMKAHSCSSTTTDPPSDKVGANSCEEFQMADRTQAAPSPEARKKALEEKWKGLFKD
jgi:hypothetical protein